MLLVLFTLGNIHGNVFRLFNWWKTLFFISYQMIAYYSVQPPGYLVISIRCSCELLRISQEQRRSCFLNFFSTNNGGTSNKRTFSSVKWPLIDKEVCWNPSSSHPKCRVTSFSCSNCEKASKNKKIFFFEKFVSFRIFVELLKNFFIFYFLSWPRDDESTSKVLLPLKETPSIQKFVSYDGMTGLFTIFGLYFSFYLPA